MEGHISNPIFKIKLSSPNPLGPVDISRNNGVSVVLLDTGIALQFGMTEGIWGWEEHRTPIKISDIAPVSKMLKNGVLILKMTRFILKGINTHFPLDLLKHNYSK